MTSNRVIVAVILIALALGAFISGGLPLAIFMAIFIFVGVRELTAMAQAKGVNPPFYYMVISNFVLIALASYGLYDLLFPAFTGILILSFLVILSRGAKASINDLSMTILGIIYAGVFPIHIIMTRNLGMSYVVLLLLAVAACDIGAYYSGKLFGKTKLWEEISPKKTVEGSIGGTIAAIVISVLVGNYFGLHIYHSAIIGLILAVLAQLGDLSESMLKRDVGMKDSGTVFPGHGGVLDRSDSYIFTSVAAYYFFKFFVAG